MRFSLIRADTSQQRLTDEQQWHITVDSHRLVIDEFVACAHKTTHFQRQVVDRPLKTGLHLNT